MSGVFDCDIARELTAADLATLGQERGSRPPSIKRLTDMHHWIAQLVSRGEAGYSIALATGYSQSRISILKSDPTFQELVAHYQAEVSEVHKDFYVNTAAKIAALHNDTIDYLHDRISEAHQTMDPTFQVRDALDIAKYSADRSGFGPSTKSQSLNLNVDIAGQLEAGRRRGDLLVARIPEAVEAKNAQADFPGLPEPVKPVAPSSPATALSPSGERGPSLSPRRPGFKEGTE